MRSLRVSCVALCALGAACLGCMERRSADQDKRPLPAPEPPAAPSAASPRDDAARSGSSRAKLEDHPSPSGPSKRAAPTALPGSLPGADTAAAPSVSSPALTPSAFGALPPPVLPSAVASPAAPSAACVARCQGALQGCLSAPVEGGLPGFGNLEICKKAFEACQAACSK